MRFSITCIDPLFYAGLCIGSPVRADNQGGLRQQLFNMDKVAALADFDTAQKQACIKAFTARYHSKYTLNGALAFNEPLSLVVYDKLFWKGEGSSQRGLIFAGSVTDQTGDKVGNLMCYYAITDYRLDFQSAYMLPLRMKEAATASNEKGAIQASLISLSSKE